MTVTKKLLIAALLVMGITLIACNNGNGGSPGTGGGSSGGTGGGGSGTGSGTTTLPASKGTDPFEGLELLIHQQGGDGLRYKVDTEKKTIVQQMIITDDNWTDFVEYNYSYDSTTTPTTITLKMTKIAPYGETLTPIEELRGMEGMEYYLPVFSQLRTYTVNISNKIEQQAAVTFEGQYNNNSPWYEQRAGYFHGTYESYDVRIRGNMIEEGDSFPIIEVTDSIIKCISMKDKSSKEFPYTITGSGEETKVTITVDGTTEVTCSWSASPSLDPNL